MSVYDSIRIPWTGWHITGELGEGGYGKVYKIERTQSGITEYAALKVISIPKSKSEYDAVRFSMDTEDEAKAFFKNKKESVLREIKTMQSLKGCANIVSIDDWAVIEKESGPGWDIFIRMELLTTMTGTFMDSSADEKDVIRLGSDICTALEQCEKNSFIHRDIKPGNILVNPNGGFKLADFGIARELDHTTFVTGVGTPPYMSPEVYNGDNADRTVDLYSLGLVMYELLNDRRLPFVPRKYSPRDEQAAVSRRMNGEEIPAPAKGGPELKKIVLKACAFEPKDRYSSASEMKKDLESVSRGGKAVIADTDAGKKSNRKTDAKKKTGGTDNGAWRDESMTVGPEIHKGAGTNVETMVTQAGDTADGKTLSSDAKKTSRGFEYLIAGAVAVIVIGMIIAFSSGGGDTGSGGTSSDNSGVTYTETKDYSSYIGDYKETLGVGSYNELHITGVKGDDISFDLSFYRLAGGSGTAVASGSDTAYFDMSDGSPGGMTGELIFGDDTITVVLDDQEAYYSEDTSLSEYVGGLTHTFTLVGSSSSDSSEASAGLDEDQLKKTVEGTWQAEDGYGWTFSILKEGTGSAEFYDPDPEGSEMISWVIDDGIIEIHSGNQRIEGTLFLYDSTEDVMWLDGEKGTVKYVRID